MAEFIPFRAWRPDEAFASRVAALPYDVYNREEAYNEAHKDALSFLNIDRPETQFPADCDMYADEVYENASTKAKTHIHPTAAKADIILSGEAERAAYRKFINQILMLVKEVYYNA